jgi:hypothetical protein
LYHTIHYVEGNPVNYRDPSGQCIWDGCIAEILAIGAGVAFIGDWVHQISANHARGLDWGQAVYGGNLNGGELVAAAGVGAVSTGVAAGAGILTLGALGITATSGTAATIGGFAVSGFVAGRAGRMTANLLTGQSLTAGVFDPGSMLLDTGLGALTGGLLKSPDILLDLRAGSDAFHPDVVDPFVANWGQGIDRFFGISTAARPVDPVVDNTL